MSFKSYLLVGLGDAWRCPRPHFRLDRRPGKCSNSTLGPQHIEALIRIGPPGWNHFSATSSRFMIPTKDTSPSSPWQNSQFTTTHWSVVLAAGGPDSPAARQALERLCQSYWYPLYAYVCKALITSKF